MEGLKKKEFRSSQGEEEKRTDSFEGQKTRIAISNSEFAQGQEASIEKVDSKMEREGRKNSKS